ncbi:signal peptidase I [Dolosicoccus paucivorans]|uniref:signal peptidase I n=1 Tax=Dolosicoccus paucivorans TaxID=84521 RepID=UPI00089253F1|nr:signal peptidase I [Dolosicoccus paucivorans]SDI26349.1 signal peptidase I [Dolosicoccus paucivorans]
MNKIPLWVQRLIHGLFLVCVALLLWIGGRHYFVQPFIVDGFSMEPTLYDGEYVLMKPTTDINRYDVVVFNDPRYSFDSYVKRVIGLPGDHVRVENNQLYINDIPMKEPYLQHRDEEDPNYTLDFNLWQITGEETVPLDHYFVLGDNRPFSGDSRQFGLVSIDDIKGKAIFILSPTEHFGPLIQYEATNTLGRNDEIVSNNSMVPGTYGQSPSGSN